MKKNILSIIALLCSAVALLLALFSVQSLNTIRADYNARLVALEAKNAILQENLTNTPGSHGSVNAELESWSLTPKAWDQGLGADVTLSAQPEHYNEALAAAFVVQLGGNAVATVPCQWDGAAYTATVSLPAANGYSYYLELVNGVDRTMIPLSTAEEPMEPYCVHLEDSLFAYANLVVSDFRAEENQLVLTDGFAEIQMPMLTPDGVIPTVASARLVLRLEEAEVGSVNLTMEPGEADGVYVADVMDIRFDIPDLAGGQELSLWLEVELSNNTVAQAYGVSWFAEDGQLYLITG